MRCMQIGEHLVSSTIFPHGHIVLVSVKKTKRKGYYWKQGQLGEIEQAEQSLILEEPGGSTNQKNQTVSIRDLELERPIY